MCDSSIVDKSLCAKDSPNQGASIFFSISGYNAHDGMRIKWGGTVGLRGRRSKSSEKWRLVAIAVAIALFCYLASASAMAQRTGGGSHSDLIPFSLRSGAVEGWTQRGLAAADQTAYGDWRIKVEQPTIPEINTYARIKAVSIEGANTAEADRLQWIANARLGDLITYRNLVELLSELNAIQKERGEPFRAVYIPSQQFDDGELKIAVSSGRLTQLNIHGANPRQRADLHALARESLAVITEASLQQFADSAVEATGRSLTLIVSPAALSNGDVQIDLVLDARRSEIEFGFNNYAPIFVSRESINAELVVLNLLHAGDEITFAGSASVDLEQLRFYRFAYETPLFTNSARLALSAGRFELNPKIEFLQDIGFQLTSNFFASNLAIPLYQSQTFDIELTGEMRRRDVTRWINNRSARNVIWNAGFGGEIDINDERWGETNLFIRFQRTLDIFDATPQGSTTTLRKGLGPGENSWRINFKHVRTALPETELTIRFVRQSASGPLIGPEQCEYGGGPFGRGYDPTELAGDACFLVTAKLETHSGLFPTGQLDPPDLHCR